MLHTDAGLQAARDDARDWYVHFDIAQRMLALVVRSRETDSRLHPFTTERWYLGTIQSLNAVMAFDVAQKVRQASGAPPRAPQAPTPWNVDMLLAEGVSAEGALFLLRRSESMAGAASSKFQMDRMADAVKEAKGRFELALQADPACLAARLRLGKPLLEGNDLDAAAAHLRRVVDETPARAQEYLAALFLARISERRRAPGEAEAWYSRAVEACPACQVARLARPDPRGTRKTPRGPPRGRTDPHPAEPGRRARRPVVQLRAWRLRTGRADDPTAAPPGDEGRSWLPVVAAAAIAAIGEEVQQPTFRVAVDLVAVDVSVTRNRRAVSGLTLENFALYDNGVRQQLHAVWFETVPLEAFLVLDTSESVAGDRLNHLVAAARTFTAGLRGGDQAALITFSHKILVPQPLTRDLAAVSRAFSAVTAGGATALHDATSLALHTRAPGPNRGVAVVFTDGYDTASWLSEQQVVEASERSDLVVYGVSATERWTAKQNPFPPQDRFLGPSRPGPDVPDQLGTAAGRDVRAGARGNPGALSPHVLSGQPLARLASARRAARGREGGGDRPSRLSRRPAVTGDGGDGVRSGSAAFCTV